MLRGTACLLMLALVGCMANRTRGLEVTVLPQASAREANPLNGRSLGLLLEMDGIRIGGGHHEGLLQVRQPWIFGLTATQRAQLYDQAGPVAFLAFAAELKLQGVKVEESSPELELRGRLQRVDLHTYGKGTKEGFGSAGDYWEATLSLEDLELRERTTGRVLWRGRVEEYAKVKPCPASLDWDLLTLSLKILKGSVQLQTLPVSGVAALRAGNAYVHTFEADYRLDTSQVSPIEMAARKAAQKLLFEIRATPANPR